MLRRRTTRLFSQVEAAFQGVAGASQPDASKRLATKLTGTQIRSLIAIWESGSFRAAAERLQCSQPAVHRPARDLERSLKVSLFRKTPHGVGLTRPGAELARRLSIAMREIVSGLEELTVLAGRPQSRLSVGSLVLAPKRLLADCKPKSPAAASRCASGNSRRFLRRTDAASAQRRTRHGFRRRARSAAL